MTHLSPVETLEAEHRVIQKVVAGMVVLADRIESGGEIDVALLDRIVEFLQIFADRCHHGKEEAWFFPALARRGVPSYGCPLGGLTMEHQKGRQMVGEFSGAIRACERGEEGAREKLVKALRWLATFYPNHIWKEDYLLFPLAGKFLTPGDQAELAQKFEAVEREVGHEVHERLTQLAKELESQLYSGPNA
ncbi:MAG: hemerythrin domain-containing protein [Acidobacteriales bacterium]|nr:hemerythrin domain-containing protein [Terriglobales bacterium]